MEKMQNEPVVGTQCSGPECENCAKVATEKAQNEETSMAFLLALMPVLTLTFFGQVGLL
jgi:nitrate reductase NapE component